MSSVVYCHNGRESDYYKSVTRSSKDILEASLFSCISGQCHSTFPVEMECCFYTALCCFSAGEFSETEI